MKVKERGYEVYEAGSIGKADTSKDGKLIFRSNNISKLATLKKELKAVGVSTTSIEAVRDLHSVITYKNHGKSTSSNVQVADRIRTKTAYFVMAALCVHNIKELQKLGVKSLIKAPMPPAYGKPKTRITDSENMKFHKRNQKVMAAWANGKLSDDEARSFFQHGHFSSGIASLLGTNKEEVKEYQRLEDTDYSLYSDKTGKALEALTHEAIEHIQKLKQTAGIQLAAAKNISKEAARQRAQRARRTEKEREKERVRNRIRVRRYNARRKLETLNELLKSASESHSLALHKEIKELEKVLDRCTTDLNKLKVRK